MNPSALDTPVLLVDLDQLERNIDKMAVLVREAGVKLRPHTKTHKTPEVARLQLDRGATGITVAKLGEAEVMAEAGCLDILIANEVIGEHKVERMARLSKKANLRSCVDSLEGAELLSRVAQRLGVRFTILLDVNTGLDRTGLSPTDAAKLGEQIADLPGLDLIGVFSYAGYKPGIPLESERRKWAEQEATIAVSVAKQLQSAGIEATEVSVAGSSSAPFAVSVPGVTEVRPGQYVFNDMNMQRMGMCELSDCALTIQARVISRPAPDRAVVDAGSKVLTTERRIIEGQDPGFGSVKGYEGVRIDALWEEHGVLQLDDAGRELRVGDVVEIIPNHVCPTVNLADSWYGVRDGVVEREFAVAARGRTA